MADNKSAENENTTLVGIVSTAIQVPGVKVDRDTFLREQFKNTTLEELKEIIEYGPIAVGRTRDELKKKAQKLINTRTLASSGASFVAGLPGGLAMAATIPADMLQFYAVALRLAQELAYLYGEGDLWNDGMVDNERVTNQLILYCGAMLGANGAAQSIRVMTAALSKQLLKKLPQKALTKTFYYPVVKAIAKAFGVKMTKSVFAKGISKVVPVIGGVVSGGLTMATMIPMGNRLADAFDEAHFDYTQQEMDADWRDITEICEKEEEQEEKTVAEATVEATVEEKISPDEVMSKIKQAKDMLDAGIINDEEFSQIKAKLLKQM